MITRTATVRNEYGVHVRPSAVIARQARECVAHIEVESPRGMVTDAKNLLGVISLGITCGQTVTIRVDGPDEEATAARMVELFETPFDFER